MQTIAQLLVDLVGALYPLLSDAGHVVTLRSSWSLLAARIAAWWMEARD